MGESQSRCGFCNVQLRESLLVEHMRTCYRLRAIFPCPNGRNAEFNCQDQEARMVLSTIKETINFFLFLLLCYNCDPKILTVPVICKNK